MSSIASVCSSSYYNPYQYLSQASSAQNCDATSTAAADASSSAAGDATSTAASFQDQLITAVTSAVADAEQSGNTTDLKSVIQNAAQQVFQADGIDPQLLPHQATGRPHGRHHGPPPPPPGESPASGDATDATQSTSTDSQAETSTETSTGTSDSDDANGSAQTSTSQLADFLLQFLAVSGTKQPSSGSLLDLKV